MIKHYSFFVKQDNFSYYPMGDSWFTYCLAKVFSHEAQLRLSRFYFFERQQASNHIYLNLKYPKSSFMGTRFTSLQSDSNCSNILTRSIFNNFACLVCWFLKLKQVCSPFCWLFSLFLLGVSLFLLLPFLFLILFLHPDLCALNREFPTPKTDLFIGLAPCNSHLRNVIIHTAGNVVRW